MSGGGGPICHSSSCDSALEGDGSALEGDDEALEGDDEGDDGALEGDDEGDDDEPRDGDDSDSAPAGDSGLWRVEPNPSVLRVLRILTIGPSGKPMSRKSSLLETRSASMSY